METGVSRYYSGRPALRSPSVHRSRSCRRLNGNSLVDIGRPQRGVQLTDARHRFPRLVRLSAERRAGCGYTQRNKEIRLLPNSRLSP